MILFINIQQFTTIIIMCNKQKSKVVLCSLLKINHSFLEPQLLIHPLCDKFHIHCFIVIFVFVHH